MRISISNPTSSVVELKRGEVTIAATCGARAFTLKPDPGEDFAVALELAGMLHDLAKSLKPVWKEHVLKLVTEGPRENDDIPF